MPLPHFIGAICRFSFKVLLSHQQQPVELCVLLFYYTHITLLNLQCEKCFPFFFLSHSRPLAAKHVWQRAFDSSLPDDWLLRLFCRHLPRSKGVYTHTHPGDLIRFLTSDLDRSFRSLFGIASLGACCAEGFLFLVRDCCAAT